MRNVLGGTDTDQQTEFEINYICTKIYEHNLNIFVNFKQTILLFNKLKLKLQFFSISLVWFDLFNWISTPYVLSNIEIWYICKYLIINIFLMFHCQ